MPLATNFSETLMLLSRSGVDFILVGGVAALAHGAPFHTEDLDIVYESTPENIDRLLSVLESIHAHYRDPAGRYIVPDAGKLADIQVNLLQTDLGDLDLLQSVGNDLGYRKLLETCREIRLEGHAVRVIDLKLLIESKRIANRPKDRAALPMLHQLLAMVRDRNAGLSDEGDG